MSATVKALNITILYPESTFTFCKYKTEISYSWVRKKEICKKLANSKKRKIINNVRSAGKVGSSKRVIIPQYLNEEFDWNKGNEVVIRRSGKIKLL